MTHQLVEISRTRTVTGGLVVVENYEKKPMLCRSGLWVGLQSLFTEVVVLSYEHEPEPMLVNWSINGAMVGSGVIPPYPFPYGTPIPDVPAFGYVTPYGGRNHQIELISAPGATAQCLSVQVLYRYETELMLPIHFGPSSTVCLRGSEVKWPVDKLDAWGRCIQQHRDLIERFAEVADDSPGGPVERWLQSASGDEAVRIGALVAALDQLDPSVEGELVEAIKVDLGSTYGRARAVPSEVEIRRSRE